MSRNDELPAAGEEEGDTTAPPLPWSIRLLAIAFGGYLLLRLVQAGIWLVKWISGA